jgi:hypothetical protein
MMVFHVKIRDGGMTLRRGVRDGDDVEANVEAKPNPGAVIQPSP